MANVVIKVLHSEGHLQSLHSYRLILERREEGGGRGKGRIGRGKGRIGEQGRGRGG